MKIITKELEDVLRRLLPHANQDNRAECMYVYFRMDVTRKMTRRCVLSGADVVLRRKLLQFLPT